jgi:hypothetical protein
LCCLLFGDDITDDQAAGVADNVMQAFRESSTGFYMGEVDFWDGFWAELGNAVSLPFECFDEAAV